MITETDSLNTAIFKDYFVILPQSDYYEFNKKKFLLKSNPRLTGKLSNKTFSYNSKDNDHFLTVSELQKLFKNNKLI